MSVQIRHSNKTLEVKVWYTSGTMRGVTAVQVGQTAASKIGGKMHCR